MNRRRTKIPEDGEAKENIIVIDSSDEASSSRRKSTRCSTVNKEAAASPSAHRVRQSMLVDKQAHSDDDCDRQLEQTDRRRSTRHRSPSKRYTQDFVQETRKKYTRADQNESDHEGISLDSEDEIQLNELAGKVKATTLFEDREDVEGHRIYGFKTPKKRGSMNVLVSSIQQKTPTRTPNRGAVSKLAMTPKTPSGTPSAAKRKSIATAKTPHRDRNKLKKNISKIVRDESGSDFSASESDYVPSSEEEDDDHHQDDNTDGGSTEEESSEEEAKPKRPVLKTPSAKIGIAPGKPDSITSNQNQTDDQRISNRTRARGRKNPDLQYVLQSDDYFATHSNSKVVTSDHTLDRLNTPRLPHDQLFRLLGELRSSTEHEKSIQELHEEYESYFNKWLFLMNEGFNILLYGLGSKRNLLQAFHRKVLANQPVIVINGFFPTLTVKDVLDAITGDILDLNIHSSNFHELVDIIEEEFSYLPDTHLFLIVHNLDGTMLRNSKAQNVLARLAKIDNIHLLASIDHINTPLIWDSSKLSYYNFSWWDVTTMLPYSDETAFENSLLVQNSGALALSSMKNVFKSLTTNSRGIFLVIVKHQLANKGNPHYPGMLFKDLYGCCREAFLVSTDLALRAQLTEFIDHKLVRVKRTVDGAENLLIPIESGLLDQFLEENDG
ncbi:origin recognition complex subunit 2 [Malaya genurostris]|uniref:origin recognition complex subunit 2 n=1 Tax=Malaya genurostris TaxID=325434 RepID=UPI0026F3E456|nr:origin recognition complex subunit 2 [Malaya genurostris]